MRKSDILLFGTILIVLGNVCLFTITNNPPSNWIYFWWCPLAIIALIKVALPKSKFVKWLNSTIKFRK